MRDDNSQVKMRGHWEDLPEFKVWGEKSSNEHSRVQNPGLKWMKISGGKLKLNFLGSVVTVDSGHKLMQFTNTNRFQ